MFLWTLLPHVSDYQYCICMKLCLCIEGKFELLIVFAVCSAYFLFISISIPLSVSEWPYVNRHESLNLIWWLMHIPDSVLYIWNSPCSKWKLSFAWQRSALCGISIQLIVQVHFLLFLPSAKFCPELKISCFVYLLTISLILIRMWNANVANNRNSGSN